MFYLLHRDGYVKDHLGSVHAVIDSVKNIISANDYDHWGYELEDRNYNANELKYKFTGKERDNESGGYDYFGARYYDSRIGRWLEVEPLYEKYLSYSPYIYSLNNPINIFDPNGKDPRRDQLGSLNDVKQILQDNSAKDYHELSEIFGEKVGRYVYTEIGGFIDMQHFFESAYYASIYGYEITLFLGELKEDQQEFLGKESAWDPEDLVSNKLGAIFGALIAGNRYQLEILKFINYMEQLKILSPEDPSISEDKIYIPRTNNDPSLPQKKNYIPYRGENPEYLNKNK